MARRLWRSKSSVIENLAQEPERFEFLQAVRLIERARKGAVPVGEGTDPRDEALRFLADVGQVFPASEIAELRVLPEDDDKVEIKQNFFGFLGANGPLPPVFGDLIRSRAARGDNTLKRFLDLFAHRLVSLLVRIWRKHRIGVEDKHPADTHFAEYVYCLLGLGTDGMRGRATFPYRGVLGAASLFAHHYRSMTGLEILLATYFHVPVRGHEFDGAWLDIAPDQWTHLGTEVSGANNALGGDAVLGTRVWSQTDVFELNLGPLTFRQFLLFLPIYRGYHALCDLTRFYVGHDGDFRIRLTLKREEMPRLRLSSKGMSYLGWTSWLATRRPGADDSQVRLHPRFGEAQAAQRP